MSISARPSTPSILAWALLLAALVVTLPPLAERPAAGLDPSWRLGLHLARERGITVGSEIFFTYGPWGFLTVPLTLVRSLWLASVVFLVGTHTALFSALALWMERVDERVRFLVPLGVLLFLPGNEYRLLLALLLWTRLALDARRSSLVAPVGLACGAVTMVKFSMGLAGLLLVAGGIAAALWRRRAAVAVWLGAGFLAGLFGSGLAALGSFDALWRFLAVSWQISSGYAEAQVRGGPWWQPALVWIALLAFAAGLTRNRSGAPELALPACGVMLLAMRHAFIRQETHAFIAFQVCTLLSLWIALELHGRGEPRARRLRLAAVAALGVGAMIVAPPLYLARLPGSPAARIHDLVASVGEAGQPAQRERLRADLRRQLPLPADLLQHVEGHSVDVMTMEVALVEAWQLDWQPRPLLQSYAVGTAALDDLDAAFFDGERAPERLLVEPQGLDTRHPFMDSPRTWRVILRRYEPIGWTDRWLLLGRRERERTAVERTLGHAQVGVNEALELPRIESGHLELRVELEPSWLGRLAGAAWKLPEVRLLVGSSELAPPRRIISATAHRPFPLTYPWADSPRALTEVFGAPRLPAPRGLSFFTGGGWAWKGARLEFFHVEWREDA